VRARVLGGAALLAAVVLSAAACARGGEDGHDHDVPAAHAEDAAHAEHLEAAAHAENAGSAAPAAHAENAGSAAPAEHVENAGSAAPAAHADHGAHADLPGTAALPGASLYQLEGTWTDQRGQRLALAALRGQPVLAVLFYGTCDHACPILVHRLQELEAGLDPSERDAARFLLVTFDPERDTPKQLAEYARERQLDPARWMLLHGAPDQVRELAAALGVRYRAVGDGRFNHTSRITLLDRDGAVVSQVDGLDASLEPLADQLAELLDAPSS